jgi:hypothetical protein
MTKGKRRIFKDLKRVDQEIRRLNKELWDFNVLRTKMTKKLRKILIQEYKEAQRKGKVGTPVPIE